MESFQLVGFSRLVVLAMVPYVLAGQATMLAGRTGLFIVAQEGIMLVGASVGFLGAFFFGEIVYGMLLAMLAGGVMGLAVAYFSTTLKMDQFVIGLAVFFMGLGLSTLLPKVFIGVTLKPPIVPTLRDIPIPGLSKIPFVGPVFFNQNWLVYFSIVLSLFLYYLLYKTSVGLELRAVGENPKAADSLGVNVFTRNYITALIGGMLMALAGAYLPMVYTGTFTPGIVRGRGWLAIALTFFGGWTPHLIFVGSLFFAAVEVLALRVQVIGVSVPHQFLRTLPYVATILVMVFAFRRAGQPPFLGQNYDRESRSTS